jgi:hypothetical protein
VQKLEVRLLEQAFSRTFRVRRVCNDDIEAVLEIVQELEAITNMHLDLGVLETLCHMRQELLGETNDSLDLKSQ